MAKQNPFRRIRTALCKPGAKRRQAVLLLTAACIAAVVLLNIGISALENSLGLKTDLSFNRYATVTQVTDRVLQNLEHPVEAYLLYLSGSVDAYLDRLLSNYALKTDRLHYQSVDILKNPGILSRYQTADGKTPAADSVIISCPSTGRYQILDYSDFIHQGYEPESGTFSPDGYEYEKQLTQAIAAVSENRPTVIGILQGHSEYSPEDLDIFVTLLENNHKTVKSINLLGGDSLSELQLLLIAAPQKDLSDMELQQIAEWAREGGNLMIWRDYSDPMDLPNYRSLLQSYGVVPLSGIVVAGEQDSGSYYQEPIALLPYMESLDLTLKLKTAQMDILLLPGACGFEVPTEGSTSLSTGVVLKTGPNAYNRDFSDGYDGIEKQPGDHTGEIPLALYAHRMYANGNTSRLFAIGCGAMFTQEYIYQRTFLEEFVMTLLGELAPDRISRLDIPVTAAVRPALKVGSETAATVLIIVMPVSVLTVALLVLLRRRR